MLPFRRSVGSSIKKVFIINSLCLKAFPTFFSRQKLLKQKMFEKRVKSFPLTDYISLPFWGQKTQSAKLTLLTYFTIIERHSKGRSKMNKKYWSYSVFEKVFRVVLYEQYWHKRIRLLTPLATPWVFGVLGPS